MNAIAWIRRRYYCYMLIPACTILESENIFLRKMQVGTHKKKSVSTTTTVFTYLIWQYKIKMLPNSWTSRSTNSHYHYNLSPSKPTLFTCLVVILNCSLHQNHLSNQRQQLIRFELSFVMWCLQNDTSSNASIVKSVKVQIFVSFNRL